MSSNQASSNSIQTNQSDAGTLNCAAPAASAVSAISNETLSSTPVHACKRCTFKASSNRKLRHHRCPRLHHQQWDKPIGQSAWAGKSLENKKAMGMESKWETLGRMRAAAVRTETQIVCVPSTKGVGRSQARWRSFLQRGRCLFCFLWAFVTVHFFSMLGRLLD